VPTRVWAPHHAALLDPLFNPHNDSWGRDLWVTRLLVCLVPLYTGWPGIVGLHLLPRFPLDVGFSARLMSSHFTHANARAPRAEGVKSSLPMAWALCSTQARWSGERHGALAA
jgi:hypothetical protein